jgi:hypothetical protein
MPHKGTIKAQKVERIAIPIPIILGKNKEIIMISTAAIVRSRRNGSAAAPSA